MTGGVALSPLVTSFSRGAFMRVRWRSLIFRVAVAVMFAWVLASVPLPWFARNTWFAYVQVPVVVFILICYLGKLLLDTFFYNHYRP